MLDNLFACMWEQEGPCRMTVPLLSQWCPAEGQHAGAMHSGATSHHSAWISAPGQAQPHSRAFAAGFCVELPAAAWALCPPDLQHPAALSTGMCCIHEQCGSFQPRPAGWLSCSAWRRSPFWPLPAPGWTAQFSFLFQSAEFFEMLEKMQVSCSAVRGGVGVRCPAGVCVVAASSLFNLFALFQTGTET